ncbi:unnamed protein product [Tilletia controversa]|uniref:Uncharacterized protein n=3 Tax=Tilletia TaxID=13289 RepID=A0A8X7MX67_9BASI|nr:hypothetical protein CF335_g9276 [Tilletia laevis]KAE8194525.1 hypothetical protein CF328_g4718 [Tilletia controversa]KAE8246333.1 hypothetical protein A4X03_0g7279 [Tilletia caries]KAE8186250.1 hypothetical protein CF336_g7068 [Tilletia laevis]KAE8252546.1 hypothetical protein A4X06_0g2119 [Tilletia controversa]
MTRNDGAYTVTAHKKDKNRRVAGWKAALNNPNTTNEGRSHARKQLLMRGHVKDALFSSSFSTKLRRAFGLRAKNHRRH